MAKSRGIHAPKQRGKCPTCGWEGTVTAKGHIHQHNGPCGGTCDPFRQMHENWAHHPTDCLRCKQKEARQTVPCPKCGKPGFKQPSGFFKSHKGQDGKPCLQDEPALTPLE